MPRVTMAQDETRSGSPPCPSLHWLAHKLLGLICSDAFSIDTRYTPELYYSSRLIANDWAVKNMDLTRELPVPHQEIFVPVVVKEKVDIQKVF